MRSLDDLSWGRRRGQERIEGAPRDDEPTTWLASMTVGEKRRLREVARAERKTMAALLRDMVEREERLLALAGDGRTTVDALVRDMIAHEERRRKRRK